MTVIRPFKGLRYNPEISPHIESIVAPPYDVIKPDLQDSLYRLHPNNVIRLILGKTYPDDNENSNRYTRAATCFSAWSEDKILVRDSAPSIYVYSQKYTFNNVTSTRTGFISLFQLESFDSGKIRPHENTLSKPKEDRLKLTKACNAQFSQIFSLYSDKERVIETAFKSTVESSPVISFCDDSSVEHSLWQITDISVINTITEVIKEREVLIADGHHRYETALNYQKLRTELNPAHTGNEPYNYVMMYLTNTHSEGLSIFPTHRIVSGLPSFSKTDFLKKSEKLFHVEKINVSGKKNHGYKLLLETLETRGASEKIIGIYLGEDAYYSLSLREVNTSPNTDEPGKTDALRWLDVSILHTDILENTIGLTQQSQREQKNITYTVDPSEAVQSVDQGNANAVFFLNPTKIEEIENVANAGEKMPQKSTFFYPKLKTGLVFNSLD